MDNSKWKDFSQRVRKTKGFELLSTFIKSAAVGLLFAVICFAYDVYHDSEQDKQLEEQSAQLNASIQQLIKIEKNLSTRYLGIFPDYIPNIGSLFEELDSSDTVVIFEDVLYYGIKSRPKEFCNLHNELFAHARNNGSITVAFYNVQDTSSRGIFHKMIMESRIDMKYIPELNDRRRKEAARISRMNPNDFPIVMRQVDSTLCEQYFEKTRDDNPEKFKKDILVYLDKNLIPEEKTPFTEAEEITYHMCVEIDSIKQYYLGRGKPYDAVTFYDYEKMYREISNVIIKYYKGNGIEMVPLDEYLTMSCWMVRKGKQKEVKTVLAFPSKYSTDEIGFCSQDEAFSKYISTMLDGVRQNKVQ